MTALAACSGSDGGRGRTATTASTPPSATASTVPPTTASTGPATTSTTEPAGAVTLHVASLALPDRRAGGTGLRAVVRAASPVVRVRRRGGAGAVAACPVSGVEATVSDRESVDLALGATVEIAAAGVEVRAAAGTASADEVAITYVPVDRRTTIVTPARPAGACDPNPCEMTFTLTPARPGPFTLDGRASGGRPRLVLTATPSNRMLATVEGGAALSIRATLEAGAEASLLHHEQGPGAVAPVTADISWP
jgi:hypothetical protein